jgi:hypothetical protein
MKRFKHSGTTGDIIYALPLVQHFGGGEFYLHLNQVDWIGQHYYGSPPAEYHKGRMNEGDFEFMRAFMEAQSYITKFDVLDPGKHEITHNLDRFRPLFVGHPANYATTYCLAFGIRDAKIHTSITDVPCITVPNPRKIPGKPYVINRSIRGFNTPGCNPEWNRLREQGVDQQSVFVGLPEEHEAFQTMTGWQLDHYPVKNMLEMAEVIAGCDKFYGNQSIGLSIAQGLQVPYSYETRRDLSMDRNEGYYPNHENGGYF